jgi:hypothetical protein
MQIYKLTENVVMDKSEADHFSARLQCEPVLVDASDFGLISRPRLWWTSIDWDLFPDVRYASKGHHTRVFVPDAHHPADSIDTGELHFSNSVLQGQCRMPCLTTPAPTDAGRPAPKNSLASCSPDTIARWETDGRRFAPWHYQADCMLQDAQHQFHIPPAEVKEQLHMLPTGYTDDESLSDRDRHRLLGNGWHAGVARFLLTCILLTAAQGRAAAMPTTIHQRPLLMAAQFFLQLLWLLWNQ